MSKLIVKYFFFIMSLVIVNDCWAAGEEILIMKSDGSVVASDAVGKREQTVGVKSVLAPKSILTTGPNGRAVVRMGDAGYIVLGENSKIELDNTRDRAWFLRQIRGMIYYAVNKMKGGRSFEVNMTTAVVGVRGTRFLVVDTPKRNEIDMRKGRVSIASPEGEFEIHKKAVLDEFEAFKEEGRKAVDEENKQFEEYKSGIEKEFVEYKREFGLGENQMAAFEGKRVTVRKLSAESEKDMATSESYVEEWLNEVRD